MTKKAGFTQIDNDVLEALMRADLTGAELRVTLMMLRMTAGFQQRPDTSDLGINKIMHGIRGADGALKVPGTNLSRRAVTAALKELADHKKILRIVSKGTYRHTENVYGFRCVEEWATSAEPRTSAQPCTSQQGVAEGSLTSPTSAQPRTRLGQNRALPSAQPCTSTSAEATPAATEINKKDSSLKETLRESMRAPKNEKGLTNSEGDTPSPIPEGNVSLNEENGGNEGNGGNVSDGTSPVDLVALWTRIIDNAPEDREHPYALSILKRGCSLDSRTDHQVRIGVGKRDDFALLQRPEFHNAVLKIVQRTLPETEVTYKLRPAARTPTGRNR